VTDPLTRPDADYCLVCGRHYTEPCDDGCDCESCQRMEQERDKLIRLELELWG
jgi:hypothetical protein